MRWIGTPSSSASTSSELAVRCISSPLHLHPYYRDTYQLSAADLPVASQCFDQTVSIPLYSAMTDAEVERGAQAVKQLLG